MTRTRANIMLIAAKPGDRRADKYDPEYCWTIRLLAQEGDFPEAWCAKLGVTMSTLYKWADDHPEFEEAVSISWHLLNAFWTKFARDNLANPDLKTVVLIEILRKRFPETWGLDPKNTHQNFRNRKAQTDAGALGSTDAPAMAPPAMTDDEITARLAILRRRHQEGEE